MKNLECESFDVYPEDKYVTPLFLVFQFTSTFSPDGCSNQKWYGSTSLESNHSLWKKEYRGLTPILGG